MKITTQALPLPVVLRPFSFFLVNPKRASIALRWMFVFCAGFFGTLLGYKQGLSSHASQFLGIFLATVSGLISNPAPAQQLILTSVLLVSLLGILPIEKALSGYADPVVWLVLSACILSRGMIKTGLGKRIALHLIKLLGKNTLGLGYSLVFTNILLGTLIPSNGARSGGIIFPIAKSLCEAYDSKPGDSAKKLGTFLIKLLHQVDIVICALFLTGQASNILIVKFAKQATGIEFTYGSWLAATIVPGVIALILLPLLLYRLYPPEMKATPLAPQIAQEELRVLGPTTKSEKYMLGIFAVVVGLWMTASLHHINYTVVALVGICLLLVSQVLKWEDVAAEKSAWDIFVWYGGLLMLASGLQSLGIVQHFASVIAGSLVGQPWHIAFLVIVLVYFYVHYAFASLTAHVTAMFIPFLSVAVSAGTPPKLAIISLAVASSLCACLTHYGTTPGPIYFGAGYIPQKTWWKIGFWISVLHFMIWGVIGVAWWKFLGIWI